MSTFLSYSRQDESVVKTLAQGLDAVHREVWFDHDLKAGEVWWDAILENIRSASVFLFALSDASLNSKPCILEHEYARELGRPILPVQVGRVTSLRASLFGDRQIIEYRPNDAQSGFMVLAAIDDAARQVIPLPDPLPAPPPIPYAYLLKIGKQIDSTELTTSDQKAVIDQLRRALGEEADESVRQEILVMLRKLGERPFIAKFAEKEIRVLLLVYGSESPNSPEEIEILSSTGITGEGTSSEPTIDGSTAVSDPGTDTAPDSGSASSASIASKVRPEPDLGKIFGPIPAPPTPVPQEPPADPAWRPAPDAGHRWRETFEVPGQPPVEAPVENPTADPPNISTESSTDPPWGWSAPTSVRPAETAEHTTPPPILPSPPNHWGLSVVSFLFSVLFGAIAMYFSYQVDQRYRAGDQEGAERASTLAKGWGIVGLVVGGLVLIVLLEGAG
jgi:hypothetical protein